MCGGPRLNDLGSVVHRTVVRYQDLNGAVGLGEDRVKVSAINLARLCVGTITLTKPATQPGETQGSAFCPLFTTATTLMHQASLSAEDGDSCANR